MSTPTDQLVPEPLFQVNSNYNMLEIDSSHVTNLIISLPR